MKFFLIIFLSIILTFPLFAENRGVLYLKKINGKFEWHLEGNKKKDWMYSGEIKNGKPNGKGQLFSAFGKYEGEVKNGLMHGYGTYTYKSGRIRKGKFRRGKPWNVKKYDKNGKIEAEWVEGKKLKKKKTVQLKSKKKIENKNNNFRIRVYLGTIPGQTDISENSISLIWKEYGLGLNKFFFNSKSSKNNNKYSLTNSSIDLSYTYADIYTITGGLGYVFEGKGEITTSSSNAKYESKNISGYGLFGIIGTEWLGIESLIGVRYDSANFSEFKNKSSASSAKIGEDLSINATQMILGLGYHF